MRKKLLLYWQKTHMALPVSIEKKRGITLGIFTPNSKVTGQTFKGCTGFESKEGLRVPCPNLACSGVPLHMPGGTSCVAHRRLAPSGDPINHFSDLPSNMHNPSTEATMHYDARGTKTNK